VIAEIETDKATMEYEAVDEGRIGKIIVPEGAQGIKVNEPIALLLEEGEDDAALDAFVGAPPPAPPEDEAEEERDDAAGEAPPAPVAPKTEPAPSSAKPASAKPAPAAAKPEAAEPAGGRENGRVFASPLARRMAIHAGLDLAPIRGSGPQGRIVKADIEMAISQPGTAQPRAAPPPSDARPAEAGRPAEAPRGRPAASGLPALAKEQVLALAGNPPYGEKPHSGMRRVIARRLSESKQTVPHFYMSVDCAIDELLTIRAALNAKSAAPADAAIPAPDQGAPDQGRAGQGRAGRISVNDFVIRAAALALRRVPAANASWSEEAILLWERADIAVAVALDDGLITPIVKAADHKGLAQIAAETRDLAERARAGKLKPEEYQGGTFSVSNLGMHGIREFAAVINPPHGCILAIGAGEQRPVVRDGQLAVATVMTCTLSCDHRVVDGAVGAQFLAAFKRLIEDPLTMLL
jgi:pyruvate dehydrogenase E2 component (dihydrolipoamide acetyltransferase)